MEIPTQLTPQPLNTPGSKTIKSGTKKVVFAAALVAIILLIAVIFLVKGSAKETANQPNSSGNDSQTVATNSADIPSGNCPSQTKEFLNKKQGYTVCFPDSWVAQELKVSGLEVGFWPTANKDTTAPIVVEVNDTSVDLSVQNIINNSQKYEYGKTSIDKISGTEVVYTRASSDPEKSYKNAIETVVSNFNRTYSIRLNTNEETFSTDEGVYKQFLENWKFLDKTDPPPWSVSRNILVYSPWINDEVKNPVFLSGDAIAFEGVVNIRIKDNDDHTLLETTVNTISGNTRAPFEADLSFSKPTTGGGSIEVFTISAANGQEQDKVVIPVIFK